MEKFTNKEYEQLFWLAAEDLVFFSHYDSDLKEYNTGTAYPAVLVSDTFGYAVADAEGIAPGQVGVVKSFYVEFGLSGIVALVAHKRDMEPLEELQDDQYNAALTKLKDEGGL